nr:hypothetical protein [Staphylococcus arlettae]
MKKFITLSLVSFSAVALLSNNSIHAESLTKSNSLKGQQLQKEVGQKAISNSSDVEQLLQNNAQQIIEHSSKKHKEAQVKIHSLNIKLLINNKIKMVQRTTV